MALEAPDLDPRTFDDLVREARDRIPRFTPDWTNLNDADPGMTLVKLQAWLTKTLLYQVNRVPELNYIKFLELLNVRPRPPRAARCELTFTLKKLKAPTDPLLVDIPRATQVAVDDPDLEEEVVFETDHSLRAYNAAVAAVIVSSDDETQPLRLVTEYDEDEAAATVLHAFHPFGETPVPGRACYVGILLRPHATRNREDLQDVFPDGQLDLAVNATQVFDEDDEGQVVEGPLGERSLLPFEVEEAGDVLEWEVYVGTEPATDFADTSGDQSNWRRLNLADTTAGLADSGHLRLEIPEGISPAALGDVDRSFWTDLGLRKHPTTFDELIEDLQDPDLPFTADMLSAEQWETVGVVDAEATGFLSCCADVDEFVDELEDRHDASPLDPSALPAEEWPEEAGYDIPPVPPFAMVWLRARVVDDAYTPTLLNNFLLNTVPATAAVTRLEESLGTSDGRPDQEFTLARTPVWFDPETEAPDLELEVVESGEARAWTRVDDFFRQGREAEVYLLDPATGTVRFGDAKHGRIPVAGAEIVVRRYRYGGGTAGNAGAGAVSKLRSALPKVDSVTNLRAAVGGADAEPLEEVKLRAPRDLRTRDRAVTAEDFAHLALKTPGVALHRAFALARTRLGDDGTTLERDAGGSVTVVVLPDNADQETPQPSEAQIREVCDHLNRRRLVTTELWVTGPRYIRVEALEATLRTSEDADLREVEDGAYDGLLTFFHPLWGGEDGKGWPFGTDIYLGNVYDRLLAVGGVRRVVSLDIRLEGAPERTHPDALPVPDGHLVHLPRAVIDLNVGYDTRG